MRIVLVNLGIAAAYFALGRLGLLLALPPGYVTAIWPPAGLACGACLIWGGRRIWPGIALGSALTNATIGGGFAPSLLALLIAAGSTVQALVGEKLLRFLDPKLGFDNPARVARFSGAVALTCVIAATIGNIALLIAGAIGSGQLLQSFVTWWAGDALGMQIFTPLTLLLLDRRQVWNGRRVPVGAPLLLAFLLCGLVYGYVRNEDEEQLKGRFQLEVDRMLAPLRQVAALQVPDIDSLAALFRASEEVDPAEFGIFADQLLREHQGFRALEWAPLVQAGDETDYAQATARLLGASVPIVPLSAARPEPGDWRAPITYIDPLQGNQSALGLDLNSEPLRAEVLARALHSEGPVLSPRIQLKQDPAGPGGVLIVEAVRDRAGRVTGFCIGVLDLRQVIGGFGDSALQWQLNDLSDSGAVVASNGAMQAFSAGPSLYLDHGGMFYRENLKLADRRWQVLLHQQQAALATSRFTPSLLILFLAFSACGALGNVVLTTSGDRRRIAAEVEEKTRALSDEMNQRRQLEAHLREGEQRYRNALEIAQLGTWRFDPAAGFMSLDRWARIHHGIDAEQVPIDRFVLAIHPDDRERVAQTMREHLDPVQGSNEVHRFEVRILETSGAARALEVTAQVQFTGAGELRRPQSVAGTSRDISDRRQAELAQRAAREAAETAVQTRAKFVANMSHELRTPMNGILGMIALALDTALTPPQREYLLLVQESAQSLLRLLNDILDFSKMDAGKLELAPTVFDVREQFGTAVQRMAEAAHCKGLELHLRVAPEVPPMLRGDYDRLMQVLINLVSNAKKFTEQGEVVVAVEVASRDDDRVELHVSVRDTGIGIPAAAQQRIFKPFSQADSSITRRYGGTGLGLSICTQIVTLFRGRLWLDSTPGMGSGFHFTAWFDAAAGPRIDESASGKLIAGRSALIVDRSLTGRAILEELLRSWQMQTDWCDTAAAVIDRLDAARQQAAPFPLVILNLHIFEPQCGLPLVQEIHLRYANGVRMAALMSPAESPDVVERCRQAGVEAIAHLPIRASELLNTLATAVSGTRSPAAAISYASTLPPPSRVLNVLVAEDHPVNQKIVVTLLTQRGHRVALAENGREAVEQSQRQSFDVILMDIQMPELDGLAATRWIRGIERETGSHVRIVAVTASAHAGERERLLAAGMDDYLAKPYLLSSLISVVEGNVGIESLTVNASTPDPAHAAAADAKVCFDRKDLLQRCMGNAGLMAKIIATFRAGEADTRAQLHAAVSSDDLGQVEELSHRFKGALSTLSAELAAAAAAELESAARDRQSAALGSLMAGLDDEVERLLTTLSDDSH